jgi:hypothetical protein
MCMGPSWYLANDMQMHTFAPILLIPLFAWPLTGYLVGGALMAVAIATNYIGFFNKLVFKILNFLTCTDRDKIFQSFLFIILFYSNINSIVGMPYSKNLYEAPWVRCTPYVIGIFVGYFLHRMRNKKLPIRWASLIF